MAYSNETAYLSALTSFASSKSSKSIMKPIFLYLVHVFDCGSISYKIEGS